MVLNPSIKKVVSESTEQNITYDALDVIRATAYRTYGLFNGSSGSIIVSDNDEINSSVSRIIGDVDTSMKQIVSITGDLDFNMPQDIKGDCFISGFNVLGGGGGATGTFITSGAIFKYDGEKATESLLGKWENDLCLRYNAGTAFPFLIKINLPFTHFKIGDKFRIKEIFNASIVSGGTSGALFYNSKETITGTFGSTEAINKVLIPFKINV